MHADGLFMWWLKKQQELEQCAVEMPRLYAPSLSPPAGRLASDYEEEKEETPRVIVIDL